MSDELGLFNDPHAEDEEHDEPRGRRSRRSRRTPPRRKPILWVAAVVVVALIGGGVWFGLTQVLGFGSYDDYSGPGETDVIIEVHDKESTGDIGASLADAQVVASAKAFVKAGEDNAKVRAVQPGFYQFKTKVSGQSAVDTLVSGKARVGNMQIKAGTQFDDITNVADGSVVKGIVTKLHDASCAKLNGKDTCVSVEELRKVMETTDLSALGVPDWAVPDATRAEPKHRLEGLVLPDVYDVKPGWSAEELWKNVLGKSATHLQAIDYVTSVANSGYTPYQVLVMASLVEREAVTADFPKVSRVTYNRLTKGMNLQYDSTINFVLDRPAIRTRKEDRDKAGAYNTYANSGLPPTPISAPSVDALKAAAQPADGEWVYFVKCEKNGLSCFAVTDAEHEQNKAKAQANGAY